MPPPPPPLPPPPPPSPPGPPPPPPPSLPFPFNRAHPRRAHFQTAPTRPSSIRARRARIRHDPATRFTHTVRTIPKKARVFCTTAPLSASSSSSRTRSSARTSSRRSASRAERRSRASRARSPPAPPRRPLAPVRPDAHGARRQLACLGASPRVHAARPRARTRRAAHLAGAATGSDQRLATSPSRAPAPPLCENAMRARLGRAQPTVPAAARDDGTHDESKRHGFACGGGRRRRRCGSRRAGGGE